MTLVIVLKVNGEGTAAMGNYISFSPKAAASRLRAETKAKKRATIQKEESAIFQELADEQINATRAKVAQERRETVSKRTTLKRKQTGQQIPLSPQAVEILERQRREFMIKFGREPRGSDPVFFDPDSDVPTPYKGDFVADLAADLTSAYPTKRIGSRSLGEFTLAIAALMEHANDIADDIIEDGDALILGVVMGIEALYRNRLDLSLIEDHCNRLIKQSDINNAMLLVWGTLIARAHRDNSHVGGLDQHRHIVNTWGEFLDGQRQAPWAA